jgi:hypothetical protein
VTDTPALPALETLHERHYGITPSAGAALAEAAAVALGRHRTSPAALLYRHVTEGREQVYEVAWPATGPRAGAAWANAIDTTEAAAYAVVLAVVEADLGLFALSRVHQGGGADYWMGPLGSEVSPDDGELDLEAALRLEVSGIDLCGSEAEMLARLGRKVSQVRRGGDDSGLAAVVGFSMMLAGLRVT